MSAPSAPSLVGLPGGAVTTLKKARVAGGWHTVVRRGETTIPVKVTAAKDSGDGKAVYEDRPGELLVVSARRLDGQRWFRLFARLVGDPSKQPAWKSGRAWVFTTHHRATATDPEEVIDWTSRHPGFRNVSVAELHAYIAIGDVGAPRDDRTTP